MPVNWAFPAAQGEPESFLAILGSIAFCAKDSTEWPDFLLLRNFFAISKSIPGSTC